MRKTVVTLITVLLFAAFAENSPGLELGEVDIHGFVSQGYMKSDKYDFMADTEDGTFQFNEIGINFSADLTEKLRLGIQFFARDLGELGNNDIEMDWAFADYRWQDWLGIRVGKIKIPMGFYNETRDIDMLRTNILLPQSVYSEHIRDNVIALQGIGVYGDIPLSVMGNLSYQAQYGTMNIDTESGAAKLTENFGPFDVKGFDVNKIVVASMRWETPLEGLHAGGCILRTDVEIDMNTTTPLGPMPAGMPMKMDISDYTMKVFSAEYIWRNLTLSSEYATGATTSQIISNSIVVFPESEIESQGYYIGASYRFTDWFELGAYYSVYYGDKDDKDGDSYVAQGQADYRAWSKDAALTTRFDINDSWTLKLEGHSMDGTALIKSPTYEDNGKNWFLFAAKTTFSF